jgi:hypothetical protein
MPDLDNYLRFLTNLASARMGLSTKRKMALLQKAAGSVIGGITADDVN